MIAALRAVLALAGGGGAVWVVDREHGRRVALAARADYEHRALTTSSASKFLTRATEIRLGLHRRNGR